LTTASQMAQDFAFPSRPEEVDVLKFVIERNPCDANAHLHLGNLLANLGRLDEAAKCWEKATELNPATAMAWRNLGLLAWAKGDLAKAQSLYRKAATARPDDQTLVRDLANILLAAGRRPDAIEVMASMPFKEMRRVEIAAALAQAYVDETRYDDAMKLLASTPYFVNWEGQDLPWRLFNTAHIERGKRRLELKEFGGALEDFEAALTYPVNLNVGRPDKPEEAPAQYWRGKALAALGRNQDARAAWQEGVNGCEGSSVQNEYRHRCREALGKTK
jgi:tetratricopeptide (TPR) repeat protein